MDIFKKLVTTTVVVLLCANTAVSVEYQKNETKNTQKVQNPLLQKGSGKKLFDQKKRLDKKKLGCDHKSSSSSTSSSSSDEADKYRLCIEQKSHECNNCVQEKHEHKNKTHLDVMCPTTLELKADHHGHPHVVKQECHRRSVVADEFDYSRGPDKSLNGQIVLVVGGSRGNGRATALSFAEAGATVIPTSRHPQDYPSQAGFLSPVPLDVRDQDSVDNFFATVFGTGPNQYDHIDIVYIGPGILFFGPLGAATADDLKQVAETNVFGYHRIVHAALKLMSGPDPRFSVVVSASDDFCVPFNTPYSASKGWLKNYFDTFGAEMLALEQIPAGNTSLLKVFFPQLQKAPTISYVDPASVRTEGASTPNDYSRNLINYWWSTDLFTTSYPAYQGPINQVPTPGDPFQGFLTGYQQAIAAAQQAQGMDPQYVGNAIRLNAQLNNPPYRSIVDPLHTRVNFGLPFGCLTTSGIMQLRWTAPTDVWVNALTEFTLLGLSGQTCSPIYGPSDCPKKDVSTQKAENKSKKSKAKAVMPFVK